MSLWSSNECRILLAPDRILLFRFRRELSWRGVKLLAAPPQELHFDLQAADILPWSAAIRELEKSLQSGAAGRFSVILANGLVRYCLVPWSDELADENEELAFARHAFRELHGNHVDSWQLRISPASPGMPQLACAVDERLLVALRQAFARSRKRLASIEPHLMTVFNSSRSVLGEKSGWLVLIEPGTLCLAVIRAGQWRWVRTMRIDESWPSQLPEIIDRETVYADLGETIDAVFLWSPFCELPDGVDSGRWRIETLSSPSGPAGVERRHAIYFSRAIR